MMQRHVTFLSGVLVAGVLIGVSPATAQDIFFYDRWEDPTLYPTGFPQEFLDVWAVDICDSAKVHDDQSHVFSAPRGGKSYKHSATNKLVGYRNRHVLTEADLLGASVVHDPHPNAVQGTDANPLTLQFYLDLAAIGWSRKSHYMELTCGGDRAPTPMLVSICSDKVRHHIDWNGDGQMHGSIAIGQIPMMDADPCTPEERQETYRLSIYDGLSWHLLKDYPAPGANIHVCKRWNYVTLTIKTSTIDVQLRSKYNPATGACDGDTTMTTTIDRHYPGAFTAVVMAGLPPDEESGGCWNGDKDSGIENAQSWMDDIYLYDGESDYYEDPCGIPLLGACCVRTGWGSGTCSMTLQEDCTGEWLGPNTSCDDCEFCPDPFADTDRDLDVDADDFGVFQACVTGAGDPTQVYDPVNCGCFDRDNGGAGDGDIDQDDWAAFEECASGPAIAADTSCDG